MTRSRKEGNAEQVRGQHGAKKIPPAGTLYPPLRCIIHPAACFLQQAELPENQRPLVFPRISSREFLALELLGNQPHTMKSNLSPSTKSGISTSSNRFTGRVAAGSDACSEWNYYQGSTREAAWAQHEPREAVRTAARAGSHSRDWR